MILSHARLPVPPQAREPKYITSLPRRRSRSAAGRRVKEYIGVRLRLHSDEIVEGTAVHIWQEKSVQMVRVASGDLVYNVPAACAWSMKEKQNNFRPRYRQENYFA